MSPEHLAQPVKLPQITTKPDSATTIATIDDLVRQRAAEPQGKLPIVGYPASATDYVDYSPFLLDQYVARAAEHYSRIIPWRHSSSDPVHVVGLLGLSNLEYLITLLAVSRLGHTVLFLSTRISDEAYSSLLSATKATTLLYGPSFTAAIQTVAKQSEHLRIDTICNTSDFDHGPRPLEPLRHLDPVREASNISWIIHSSGSTGLPKPIYQTHSAALGNYATNFNLRGFITLPLFHAHGISCLFRAIHSRKQIYLYGANLPLTASHLITTLKERDIGIFYGVPYALKLLSEHEEGIQLLASLELVMFGGSACPKPIGDKLVSQGVQLISHYGTTETGQLMTSFRPREDKAWDYVRPTAKLEPYLRWEEREPGIYELCILNGWPSKVATNRPDGSYATKDLFERHPTLNAWRYYARLDDTLVLDNGEKANPLTREGIARENRNVAEAVVFGDNKPRLGLFIIPSVNAEGLTPDQVIDSVWPALDRSNWNEPAYARLSRDMIFFLPANTVYRRTDKGTVVRAAFYRDFKTQIEAAYMEDETAGTLALEGQELIDFLRSSSLNIGLFDKTTEFTDDSDLFSLGVDSLQSIMLRKVIVKHLNVGTNPLSTNFVFEHPSLRAMATELTRLRTGVAAQVVPIEDRMSALIKKYSQFATPQQRLSRSDHVSQRESIVLTGATGSLGAHIAAHLVMLPTVATVYCLVRAKSPRQARTRVRRSLQERRVYHTLSPLALSKLVALPAEFAEQHLGLNEETYQEIASHLTNVIHCAWSVNFNYSLESFEKDCIAGARHLLDLCLGSGQSQPAKFDFCSSVSAVAATPGGIAPEALPPSLSCAQNMGYAQSKLVTEHICMNAALQTGIRARVLRVGQIVADTKHGIWNATEAIPLLFQSALSTGALPALDENPSWLPVDTVARAITDIALDPSYQSGINNIVNHNTFHWTRDLLPKLRASGLAFEIVPQREWLARLRSSEPDPAQNPSIKLLDFFAGKYDRDDARPSLKYVSSTAQSLSPALRAATSLDAELVVKFLKYFSKECWSATSPPAKQPQYVLVFAGPCGSGKTTAAQHVTSTLQIPFVEGDELHTAEAVKEMGGGRSLADEDRWAWLARIREASLSSLRVGEAGARPQAVAVTCSALKSIYRDDLRKLNEVDGVRVSFVLLSGAAKELRDRVTVRHEKEGHYMKADMVDSQLDALEAIGAGEVDVVPIDGSRGKSEVAEEVADVLMDVLGH